MRITQQILHRSFLRNLERIEENINRVFEEVASGKKITRPSDDPVSAVRIMDMKDELSVNEQCEKNIEFAISWLNVTETAINSLENLVNRLEEIAISMGSDNASEYARKASAEEVRRLKEQAFMIANTKFRGYYIFSGEKTDTPPVSLSDGEYNYQGGDPLSINLKGEEFTYSLTASEIFFTSDDNIFKLMDDLAAALEDNDSDAIRDCTGRIQKIFLQINLKHTSIGSRTNTLENVKNRLYDRRIEISKIISQKEDLDMAEAIPKLYIYQTSYQALLHSFAKITSVRLFDIIT